MTTIIRRFLTRRRTYNLIWRHHESNHRGASITWYGRCPDTGLSLYVAEFFDGWQS